MVFLGFFSLTFWKGLASMDDVIKFVVYSIPIFMYLIFCIITVWSHLRGYFPSLNAIIHDPEKGLLENVSLVRNPLYLTVFCILIFGILIFIGIISQPIGQFIFPFTPGQITQTTTTGKLFFMLFASPSENGWGLLLIGITLSFMVFVFNRLKMTEYFERWYTYLLFVFVFSIVYAFVWRSIHVLVSGFDQVAQFNHFFFGFVVCFLTLITGSLIPMEVYHLTNNLFIGTRMLFSIETLKIVFSILLFFSIVLFLSVYFTRKK